MLRLGQLDKAQRGLGILEVILVMSVVAVILLQAWRSYQAYQRRMQVTELAQNIRYLQQAFVQYFYQHCRYDLVANSAQYAKPSVTDLVRDGVLPQGVADKLVNPWGSHEVAQDFGLQVTLPTDNNPVQLLVSARLSQLATDNRRQELISLGRQLGANKIDELTWQLQWQQLPSQRINNMQNPLWLMNMGSQGFVKTMQLDARNICAK